LEPEDGRSFSAADDLGLQIPVENQSASLSETLGSPYQTVADESAAGKHWVAGTGNVQEEHLHPAAGFLSTHEASRNHRRVVDHEHILRLEKLRQLVEAAMEEVADAPLQHHQSRSVPLRAGVLGNPIFRKRKIVVFDPVHGNHLLPM
jgi:hypothetical protein